MGIRHVRLLDGTDYVHWPEFFECLVSPDGRLISGRCLNGAQLEAFHTYVLGQVMSYALLKQGIEPLHATVLDLDGRAVALLGDSGYGKSTLGAALIQSGARLVTDDLLVVKEGGGEWLAYPGPPRLKLFPEARSAFLGTSSLGLPMNSLTTKRIVPLLHEQLSQVAVPLKVIYKLPRPNTRCRSDKVVIRKRSVRQACMDLISNTFNTGVKAGWRLEQQLTLAGRLAVAVPVKSVSYERRLENLPRVVAAIRGDLLATRN